MASNKTPPNGRGKLSNPAQPEKMAFKKSGSAKVVKPASNLRNMNPSKVVRPAALPNNKPNSRKTPTPMKRAK